ncbi:MAG: hypothetical protein IT307_04565 [Chloroflexi bacterium]|nr:hypothetical protein [Chloroflexota bacterium]
MVTRPTLGNREAVERWRASAIEDGSEGPTLKLVEAPEAIHLVVAGGPGNHSIVAPYWWSRAVARGEAVRA